ncbi:MAG TPA: hypothetical protein VFE51_28050 [Verrucomicrobiae bacterium]|nr:hypothetical protein [Verrucomicrobiae bacterium]
MNRVVRGVLFGGLLAAFVAGASLPSARQDHRPAVTQSAESINTALSTLPAEAKQPLPPRPTAYFARLAFKPVPVEVPPGVLTLLAAACLVAPFGLTTWATLRRRL